MCLLAPAGLFLAYLLTTWSSLVENLNWMWTAPLSCLATLIVGYAASILIPYKQTMPVIVTEVAAPGRTGE